MARIAHDGICAGGAQQWVSLPRSIFNKNKGEDE
jgi:hypothetical protein